MKTITILKETAAKHLGSVQNLEFLDVLEDTEVFAF